MINDEMHRTVSSIQPAILTSCNRKQDFIRLIIKTKTKREKVQKEEERDYTT